MASNAETSPATSPKQTIHFKEPFDGRRLSTSDSDVIDDDEDHYQDWTKTTDEKDSWAARERRRSSVWQKIDAYPAASGIATITTTTKKSPSNSMNEGRRGSILSMWTHGKDKLGHDVLHSGEAHDQDHVGEQLKPTTSNEAPEIRERTDRRGSILSMFSHGKDKHGKHVIHSGFEDED